MKCKDKFLIQSTIITPDKETLALSDIVGDFLFSNKCVICAHLPSVQWASPEANDEGKVFQQKLRVTYLPAEGQPLEEEDENIPVGVTSMMSANDSVSNATTREMNSIPIPHQAYV